MSFGHFFERRSRFDDANAGGLHDKDGFSYESQEEKDESHQAFEKSEKVWKEAQEAYEKYTDIYYGRKSPEEIEQAWKRYLDEYNRCLEVHNRTAERYGYKKHKMKERLH